ncbi:MAG: Valine--tRNA ligase [bacterium ADurb.Bin400]|nr:MAG: Valine--tRNA ligase [bacterium ADurb.Bin400]
MKVIPKAYEPEQFEQDLYRQWEDAGYFRPEVNMGKSPSYDRQTDGKPFVISMPPPNITGKLHMGHALFATLEDIMTRYHRLMGSPTLWLPGTDHAGIATQTVVDKSLRKQGINKNELGREKFIEKVWEWKEQYGSTITRQLRRLGSSCDWSRERFTLDEGLSHAVRTAFVDLYNKGLIYRGVRVVNWCPRCHTAIADDEVEYRFEKGKLYWLKYGPFILATARPETKLGDTAVAVHPGDQRYLEMVGKKYTIQGVLGDFEVVVVADNAVDPEFGSGAVKVTPAHSFTDYEIAQRHNVPMKQIINENGRMMDNTGKYAGMKTIEAREAIVADMEAMGLIDHIDEYDHNIATCYRCGGVIEPIPSKQWFVKTRPLAEKAKKAVEDHDIKIIPERFEKVYFDWMDNIRDWCISRQLWWGHQIPVWYKNLPQLPELPELTRNKKQVEAGQEGSPVSAKNSEEFRFSIIDPEDLSWILSNIQDTHNYEYVDFFDGQIRTRIDTESFTCTEKQTDRTGVVAKTGLSGYIDGVKSCLELRSTNGFAKYEIEFKGQVPDRFTGRPVIASTEILNHQVDNTSGVSYYVGMEPPRGEGWVQDPDVLDTWFSSALWPFSTLGWPEKTTDLDYFYPTTVMETGYDILFFWVARMVMFGLEFTGKSPFETVYLHGLVRDEHNRKMSKSLGNSLDPLDLIPKYGTDAVRMALVVGSTPGQDIPIGEGKIKGYRNFSNKIWNASRFTILRVSEGDLKTGEIGGESVSDLAIDQELLSPADQQILSRHQEVKRDVSRMLNEFRFSLAGETLYDYFWHTFADIYIEASKNQLAPDADQRIRENTKKILIKLLSETLIMLHPFMPFVTEAVWQELREIFPSLPKYLIIAKWPFDADKKTTRS